MVSIKSKESVVTLEEQLMILELKVVQHIEDFKAYVEEEDRRHDLYLAAQQQNTEGLKELTRAVTVLEESTRGIIEVYTTANSIQRFLKWASSFAIIGGGALWLSNKLFP